MKKLGIAAVVFGLMIAAWGFSLNQTEDEKQLLLILTEVLKINHFKEQKIDDDFSKRVYNQYINMIDPNKMYLLKKDVDDLKNFELTIDDEIQNRQLTFYYKSNEILKKRISTTEGFCYDILKKPFDFSIDDNFETDADKREYCSSEKELKDYWRQYLKFMTLNTYLSKIERQDERIEKEELEEDSIKSVDEIEIESREQILKNMKERFKRRNDIDEEDNFSFYLNAISNSFGPHTQYFPPQQKENFDLRMTGTLEGIGAVLQQEEGYTKISSIVTGSACWKQGQLKAGDVILKVAQGAAEPVDIVDAPMKEVLKLIRGKKGTEVRLTVEKPGGDIVVIPIVRDVVIREETYAKSALIEDKDNKGTYGYINLPSFYAKFGNEDGQNSSDDVKAELEKLKAKNVRGVILDLRDNGGGSLQDAIKMAGLFFDKGPVVQVKDRTYPVQSRDDIDASITYDGPLVIMINEFSASASEIVAAALKDYDRAVIVGSFSTYGKGTVQTFMNMNNYNDPQNRLEHPYGSLKYTVQQFYRINGSSTQFKGVHSDIVLPNLNSGLDIGEKELEYALPWDSVSPALYQKWNFVTYDLKELKRKSAERVKNNELFQAVEERVEWLETQEENSMVSLKKEDSIKEREERKKKNEEFNKLNLVDERINFVSLQEFKNDPDSLVTRKKTEWQDQLAKDAYIREAMYILSDMLVTGNEDGKVVKEALR